ncbi:MAG: cyclic nucleotide-binding domain-containing protein [Chloroflexota bacterium]|jgi:CRP/FNR family cyclic AMP-dependent transcriptional regulator|nr:cyclic nucleotide-binding domain-containing protein [Chloroflexota bacterium]MDH5242712.1 cyclic nucleotide-binding domain-containing protein [Chloroflexota bacterium]
MSEAALGRLYEDGEIVVRQGEVGDCLYVIQDGTVEFLTEEDGTEVILRTAGANEVFGEMAIFERQTRSATVRARGPARILTVDKKNFMRRINEDPSLAFNLVVTMSHRVRELSHEVVQLEAELRSLRAGAGSAHADG